MNWEKIIHLQQHKRGEGRPCREADTEGLNEQAQRLRSPSRDQVLHRTSILSRVLEQDNKGAQSAYSSPVQYANNVDGMCSHHALQAGREDQIGHTKKTLSKGSDLHCKDWYIAPNPREKQTKTFASFIQIVLTSHASSCKRYKHTWYLPMISLACGLLIYHNHSASAVFHVDNSPKKASDNCVYLAFELCFALYSQ